MKKIYLTLLSAVFAGQLAHAQAPTLTKAGNDPVIGDSYTQNGLDTSNAMPNSTTGTSVTWNISGVSVNTVVTVTTYSTPSSGDISSYPGTTIVMNSGGSNNTYLKQSGTAPSGTLEVEGMYVSSLGASMTFTNSGVIAQYPISMGYSMTDPIAGSVSAGTVSGTFSGDMITHADGTGTLNFNSGTAIVPNCLRVVTTMTANLSLLGGLVTGTLQQDMYNYFTSSSKYPVFTVQYTHVVIPAASVDQLTATAAIQPSIVLGINEQSAKNVNFTAYPNPTSDNVSLHFVLTNTENYTVEINNTLGQTVKTVSLNNLQPGMYNENIDLTGLNKGIYFVKVKGTHAEGVQKILVQ
ncbi:MAG: T9SS type A sorting domain-containing protein [Bacteroidetes bacterium]|nr:T9SS type A sorting domain-containing protein [Bacteroidota bacterium]